MFVKSILIVVFGILFLSCDGDLKQGKCEEGFFEQDIPEGGSYCVPLGEQDSIENENPDAEKLN